MQHSYFEIRNFKGIVKTRLNFTSQPRGNIYPCVGLNESGKTTILEGLNFLSYKSDDLDPLNLPGYAIKDVHELIPISQRSNFNDRIVIETGYKLNEDNEAQISKFLVKELKFTLTKKIARFYITQSYRFHNSRLQESEPRSMVWSIKFVGKSKRGRTEKELEKPQWQTAVSYVKTLLPSRQYQGLSCTISPRSLIEGGRCVCQATRKSLSVPGVYDR